MCRDLQWPKSVSAISIYSQQFQFVHGNCNSNFNLFTAISIYSRQFQFAHSNCNSNFNLLTAISFQFFTAMQFYATAFFASLTTCQLWRPTVATKHQSKHKIESRYLKSIFLIYCSQKIISFI